jgi:hypothetical protein
MMMSSSIQSFYSPALLDMKKKLITQQGGQLRHFVKSELGKVVSLRTSGGWLDLPRLTDPKGEADKFNARHVVADLSRAVPGMLGVFALVDAYPPGYLDRSSTAGGRFRLSAPPSPNLGYYHGYIMLASEYAHFNKVFSHSMGVTLSGIKGKDPNIPGIAEEGVVLVGNPSCTVVQTLHNDRAPNCVLTSRIQAGDKLVSSKVGQGGQALPFDSIVIQAHKLVRKGDELTFAYAPRWEHTMSCVGCSYSVTEEDLSRNEAVRCQGFIDGAPCAFTMHRDCAVYKELEYCPFCCHLSFLDDKDRTPAVWLDVHDGVAAAANEAALRCIITTASFAAALQRAIKLGWTIIQARALPSQAESHQQPAFKLGCTTKEARSRVILYECRQDVAPRHLQLPVSFGADGASPQVSSPPYIWPLPTATVTAVLSPTVTSTLSTSSEERSPSLQSSSQESTDPSRDVPTVSDVEAIIGTDSTAVAAADKKTSQDGELAERELTSPAGGGDALSRSDSAGSIWSFGYSEEGKAGSQAVSSAPLASAALIQHPHSTPSAINPSTGPTLTTEMSAPGVAAASMTYNPAWRQPSTLSADALHPQLERTEVNVWTESQAYLALHYRVDFSREEDADHALAMQAMLRSDSVDCPPVDCDDLSDCMRRIHEVGMAFVIAFINALLLELCHQQLPPFEDGCYWWCQAEGMERVISTLFRESRVRMERWLEDEEYQQTSRRQKWLHLLDEDTSVQERAWRAELAHVIDHCYGPGSKDPHDRTVIYAPAVMLSLQSRAKLNEVEWRSYILNIRGPRPYTHGIGSILYRMLRMWLKEVVVQLEQRCSASWIGKCPARASPLLTSSMQKPMQAVINEVGRSDQWMRQIIGEVVEERNVELLRVSPRPFKASEVDVVAAFQYLWYTVYCNSQQSALEKALEEDHHMAVTCGGAHPPPSSTSPVTVSAINGGAEESHPSHTVTTEEEPMIRNDSEALPHGLPIANLGLQPSYSSPSSSLPTVVLSLHPTDVGQRSVSDLRVVEVTSVQSHPPSSPLIDLTTAYEDTTSVAVHPSSAPSSAAVVIMTSQRLLPQPSPASAAPLFHPPSLAPDSMPSAPEQCSTSTSSFTSHCGDDVQLDSEGSGEPQPSQTSSDPASSLAAINSGMAGSAAAAAGVTVTDDMEWEEVTHEDEPTAAAQRRRQQQRERSAARRRRMTDLSSDPSSDDSEWRPPTAHSTQNGIGDSKEEDDAATESDSSTPGVAISRTGGRRLPSTVPFPSSSFSSSSNATTNHIPPPAGVTVDAEGNDLEGMDASAVSSSSAAATAAGVISLHTETQLAFADLPGRESNSSGGKLSPAARQACVKLRQQHLTQSVAHASRQISKSKKRKGQPSANGQKRALELERMRRVALQALQQPTHSQSVVATPKPSLAHCKRGVCDIDAFEQRLQSFFRHCGRIHSDKVGRILKGQETSNIPRVVWEAREQRLLTLEKYPERMFKVQLASSNKTYSQHRAAFWLTYAHLAPRGCQPPSQPQADTSDGHESIDEDIHMVDSAITANPAPLPSSTTVTSASASSPSSSSLPPTSMDAIRGNTALTSHSAATSSESSHSDTSPAEAAAILGLCYQDIPLCLKCYSHVYPYVSLSTLTDWVLRLVRGKGYSEASTRSATGEHGNRLRGSSIAHPMTTATNRAIRHLALARGDAAPNSNTTMLVERSYEQLTKRVNVHVQAETGRGVSLSLVRKV